MHKFWFEDENKRTIFLMKGVFALEPVKSIKTEKIDSNTDYTNQQLTSAEMGKLWATYVGNTMAKCILSYYLQHVDDGDIKKIVENALTLSESLVKNTKEIFIREGFPLPTGFTDEDVNLGAPRLFSDEFYLHYLKYTCKAGMSIYSIAVPLMIRPDVKDFFIHTLDSTVKLITQVNEALEAKGFFVKPPTIPVPNKVEYVQQQNEKGGFFGIKQRPLHALEIAHIFDNIENNVTSKALLIAFSQTANLEKVRNFMQRGKEITNKHIKKCSQQLNENHLPSPPLLDDQVSTSNFPPFSDRLMIWHKVDMFSMKIRSYANGVSLNGRRDIGAMYAKFLMDISLYLEDGADIMMNQGWMEYPPEAPDRDELVKG